MADTKDTKERGEALRVREARRAARAVRVKERDAQADARVALVPAEKG